MADDGEKRSGFSGIWENLTKGAQNALEIARVGRLSPELHAPYTVVRRERVYKLRHYERNRAVPPLDVPLLLVPPLMVTAEIYDIDPAMSTVTMLCDEGVDVWVVDFGSPEKEEGGLERTLDDHVRAVSQAIDHVRNITGQDVHLAGYSQGGMFCYQTAAYRRSAGLRSVITFGAPVDIFRNLIVRDDVAMRFIDSISGGIKHLLDAMEALPGAFSSIGFRVLSAKKELKQQVDFVTNLHDRDAIMRGESSRRFLHGEGFVAWPGPALRNFFEQFVVQNRMTQGGFVIDGRTLTLADITCPILYFVGERDEFARGPSVRAIRTASPHADTYEVSIRTGHFGLVVGSISKRITWRTTIDWMRWHENKGLKPGNIRGKDDKEKTEAIEDVIEANFEDVEYNARLLFDTARETASALRRRLSGISGAATHFFDNVRYQVPRLARLERVTADTPISVGLALAEQAAEIPDHTFFLWQGRAHSYADADKRVDAVVRGLISCGVKPNMHVGVLMVARPTYLSLVAALSRLGAVAVLISPDGKRLSLTQALTLGKVETLITDPEHAGIGRETFDGPVLVLGGGGKKRSLGTGVVDMEAIDPERVVLPSWYTPNPGRAGDLALIMFTAGKDEKPRAARITNRRWAVAAYGAAAASTLTSKDTVYCCMPLDHAAGLLVSVGGALVGGARLALADGFDPKIFWSDVRRYGVTCVYYAGEMCRALVDAPSTPADSNNPVRLFAGSGMRTDVWKRLIDRFDAGVLEFYATTEGNAVLANVSGQRIGSLGKPLPGTSDIALIAYDFDKHELARDHEGKLQRCYPDQPGMLVARIDTGHPMAAYDGYVDEQESSARVLRSAFEPNDAWFVTGDILRLDSDGHYWFVDRVADMVRTQKGPVSSVQVEDVLYELPEIQHAVVVGVTVPGATHELPVAHVVVREGYVLDPITLARHVEKRLDSNAFPRFVYKQASIAMSVGFRPLKPALRELGIVADLPDALRYDADHHLYEPLTSENFASTVVQAGGDVSRTGKAKVTKSKTVPPAAKAKSKEKPAS